MYLTTSKIQLLASDVTLQLQCLHYFFGKKNDISSPSQLGDNKDEQSILQTEESRIEKIMEMYCFFKPGTTVKDFCLEYESQFSSLGIDERYFFNFL